MDVSVASYYIERKTIKVAKWGTPKKKKKIIYSLLMDNKKFKTFLG
jgi:hypothetical protein